MKRADRLKYCALFYGHLIRLIVSDRHAGRPNTVGAVLKAEMETDSASSFGKQLWSLGVL